MNVSVFYWPFKKRYYLTHPIKWVKQLFYIIRDIYYRARYGWCYSDCWNFDNWYCIVIPQMLRHIAKNGCCYPGTERFDTKEKWHDWLFNMAYKFEHLQYDTWLDDNNEYSEEYYRSFENELKNPNGLFLTTNTSLNVQEVREKYYKRAREIAKMRPQVLEEVFKEFSREFDCIWD